MTDETVIDKKTKTKSKVQKPKNYHVILLNDDYTTMAFVIGLLSFVFHKTDSEAFNITREIHEKGKGIAGTFSLEIAETKAAETIMLARQSEFPLTALVVEE